MKYVEMFSLSKNIVNENQMEQQPQRISMPRL